MRYNENLKCKLLKKRKLLITNKNKNKNKEYKCIRHPKYAENYLNNSFLNLIALPMF